MTPARVLLLGLALLAACARTDAPAPDPGYEYFPLRPGYFREYEVSETQYALTQPPRESTYRMRETTGPPFADTDGQLLYPIARQVWENGEWRADSVLTAWRTPQRAFVAENGRRFVKIQFPVRDGARWDGNAFNALAERPFELTAVGKAVQLATLSFERALTVIQLNDSTLLGLRRSRETYAYDVGLVSREETAVRYCGQPDCLGQGIVESGFVRTTTLIDYGK